MIRSVLLFSFGALVGGGVIALSLFKGEAPVLTPPHHEGESIDGADSLRAAKGRISALEAEIQRLKGAHSEVALGAQASASPHAEAGDDTSSEADDERQRIALRWRVSAIEKFVPLTQDQRDRLTEKFARDAGRGSSGEGPATESLEDILGADNARFYHQQVQAAFARAQDQEIEREVVWLSRQLSLTPEQESGVRQAMARVEEQLRSGQPPHGSGGSDPQARVRAMIEESRARRDLTNAELRKVLTPDQYQAYLRSEAESADSDVEIFHDSGTTPP